MRFDCAGSHNIIVRNIIIIITTSIIIINFILHYLPTPPTLFGVSCRDNFTCLSSSPAFSLLGSWNAQVRKCVYIYIFFARMIHDDSTSQRDGHDLPGSWAKISEDLRWWRTSSGNFKFQHSPKADESAKIAHLWNQCEINVKSMWIFIWFIFKAVQVHTKRLSKRFWEAPKMVCSVQPSGHPRGHVKIRAVLQIPTYL